MAITRHKNKDNEWFISSRKGSENLRRKVYKLHISVDLNSLPHYRTRLNACLDDALIKHVVTKYKYFNYHDDYAHYVKAMQGANDSVREEQMASLKSSKITADIEKYQSLLKVKMAYEIIAKADKRYIYAIPYTVYLLDVVGLNNFSKIAALCQRIEDLLRFVSCGSESDLCVSDIQLTPHVWFRQSHVNKKYVNSFDAEFAFQARTEGEKSEHYNRLKKALHPSNEKQAATTPMVVVPVEEKTLVKDEPVIDPKAPRDMTVPGLVSYCANQRLFPVAQNPHAPISDNALVANLCSDNSTEFEAKLRAGLY
jgi:hypothetical protein